MGLGQSPAPRPPVVRLMTYTAVPKSIMPHGFSMAGTGHHDPVPDRSQPYVETGRPFSRSTSDSIRPRPTGGHSELQSLSIINRRHPRTEWAYLLEGWGRMRATHGPRKLILIMAVADQCRRL